MESIQRYLKTRGFVPTREIALTNTPCFTGRIAIGGWDLQLELRFNKGKYDYPVVYLPEWPHDPELRKAFGFRHINAKGLVCYVDESRSWWDSAMSVELVAGVLEDIERLLNENLDGASGTEAIARDFGGYWNGTYTLYTSVVINNKQQYKSVREKDSQRDWLVPLKGPAWLQTEAESRVPWLSLSLQSAPVLMDTDTWPPTTFEQVVSWMDQNVPNAVMELLKEIQKNLRGPENKKKSASDTPYGVVLTWPTEEEGEAIGCGFRFVLPKMQVEAIKQSRLKKVKAMLAGAAYMEVERFRIERADPQYIQQRNTPETLPLLKDKHVVLVGAGTIGGHLAKLLCAHGAGDGKRGKLHIIDQDIFSVENVGRHLLGFKSISENKAVALRDRLRSDFPYLNIDAHPKPITDYWHLLTNDCIIVDATGCQTVSIAISDYLTQAGLTPKVLHSWVVGHGVATVAFLNDRSTKGAACFRCLWHLKNGTYKPRYPLSRNPEDDTPRFVGCHQSYHAYASTISMMAATQAMNLLHDDLSGRSDNSLRFQVLRPDLCQDRPDKNPAKSKDCPLCQRS